MRVQSMADAQELRDYAAKLRSSKFNQYDDWRNLCLGAANLLVRQASHNEALLKERAELIVALDQSKQAVLNEKQAFESEIQKLQHQLTEVSHWLFVERKKNKK